MDRFDLNANGMAGDSHGRKSVVPFRRNDRVPAGRHEASLSCFGIPRTSVNRAQSTLIRGHFKT